jgi:hypothetical protein
MINKSPSFVILSLVLASCANNPNIERADPLPDKVDSKYEGMGKLFGDDAFTLGGDRTDNEATTGIGVNSFLWRASLDTISFIPLQSADPFGGVIITEWYSSIDTPNERLKITILILGRSLRTDGIKAKIFKQIRNDEKSEWKDTEVSPATIIELEDAILMRARQLRVATGK